MKKGLAFKGAVEIIAKQTGTGKTGKPWHRVELGVNFESLECRVSPEQFGQLSEGMAVVIMGRIVRGFGGKGAEIELDGFEARQPAKV